MAAASLQAPEVLFVSPMPLGQPTLPQQSRVAASRSQVPTSSVGMQRAKAAKASSSGGVTLVSASALAGFLASRGRAAGMRRRRRRVSLLRMRAAGQTSLGNVGRRGKKDDPKAKSESEEETPVDSKLDDSADEPAESGEPEMKEPEAEEKAKASSDDKSPDVEPSISSLPPVGEWQKVRNAFVLRPPPWIPASGVVHFMGGAFACAAPHWTYRRLLTALSEKGLWVVTTPVALSFNHLDLVAEASQSFEEAYGELTAQGLPETLPVYGAGHSLGALLTGLLSSGSSEEIPADYTRRIKGHIFISYNSQKLADAVPLWNEVFTQESLLPSIGDAAKRLSDAGERASQVAGTALEFGSAISKRLGFEGAQKILGGRERVEEFYAPLAGQLAPLLQDVSTGLQDFKPSGEEVQELLKSGFPKDTPVLLVRFTDDPLDQTEDLEAVFGAAKREGQVQVVELSGAHILPNFNELPDLLDGTDVLGRGALGAESPIDAALLSTNAQLLKLTDAVASFTGSTAENSDAAGVDDTKPPLQLAGLTANDLRHPLDERQTKALERLPGLAIAVRQLAGMVEQATYLDNLSTSVQVGEKQYANLYQLLVSACDILDIPEKDRPELYIRQNPVPNAYTLAVQGKRPFIVIHTALLDILCEKEVQAVIAHELGHLKCEHGVWLTAANVLLLGAAVLPLPVRVLRPVLERLEEDLGTWQRAAELSCDRAALLVAQEPWTPTSVIMKLSGGGVQSTGKEVLPRERLEAFLSQAEKYDDARINSGPLGSFMSAVMQGGRPRTHPIPVLRAREMRRWADSEQFRRILHERGVEYNPDGPKSEAEPEKVPA